MTAKMTAKTLAIKLIFSGLMVACAGRAEAQGLPRITHFSPLGGPENTRVDITGQNFENVTHVLFAGNDAAFKVVSPEEIVAIVPHKVSNAFITVVTAKGRAPSAVEFVVNNDPRVPTEVSYKAGYVNAGGRPEGFRSAMLWGIAIADPRAAGYESAEVAVASTRLTCTVDGKEVVLNDDQGNVRGGLYRRHPWFGTDQHEAMPMVYDRSDHAVVMRVGQRPDKVWHFWSASPRPELPAGKLDGCTVSAWVRISPGALLQIGMDYWRDTTVEYGPGGNNHEAGASHWYFAAPGWQEATFTDIGAVEF